MVVGAKVGGLRVRRYVNYVGPLKQFQGREGQITEIDRAAETATVLFPPGEKKDVAHVRTKDLRVVEKTYWGSGPSGPSGATETDEQRRAKGQKRLPSIWLDPEAAEALAVLRATNDGATTTKALIQVALQEAADKRRAQLSRKTARSR